MNDLFCLQTSAEERYRRKEKKKSRGRSKSRSRGESPTGGKERSWSRSRDATLDRDSKRKSRRSNLSLEETPILAMPGDIILTESHAPRESAPLSPGQMERDYRPQPRGGLQRGRIHHYHAAAAPLHHDLRQRPGTGRGQQRSGQLLPTFLRLQSRRHFRHPHLGLQRRQPRLL